jgi:hypothetical protein
MKRHLIDFLDGFRVNDPPRDLAFRLKLNQLTQTIGKEDGTGERRSSYGGLQSDLENHSKDTTEVY